MPKRKARNARGPSKSKRPDVTIQPGQILADMRNRRWIVGDAVARGGFGFIYEAKAAGQANADDSFIVKVEPITNGPLFCEIHFYMRTKGQQSVQEFAHAHGLSHLGMPIIHGCGQGPDCRFLVMERYGSNLAERRMSTANILRMSTQLLYTLEYIHSMGYTHNDVKETNLVLGRTDSSRVYLIDFGLANRYFGDSGHVSYTVRPSCTHEGTLEYTSIDAHMGVRGSRRSDLEVLFYNIVDWLCGGRLPWKAHASDPNRVENMKKTVKRNPEEFLRSLLRDTLKIDCVKELARFARHVYALSYEQEPDYEACRRHLLKMLSVVEPGTGRFDGLLSLPLDGGNGGDEIDGGSKRGGDTASNASMSSTNEPRRVIVRPRRRNVRTSHAAVQTDSRRR